MVLEFKSGILYTHTLYSRSLDRKLNSQHYGKLSCTLTFKSVLW